MDMKEWYEGNRHEWIGLEVSVFLARQRKQENNK